MYVTPTMIPDVVVLQPRVFPDDRGYFLETFNARAFREAVGVDVEFVQDNFSRSRRDVLRGLHYQLSPQGKLVRVSQGAVLDVAVDIRLGSPTFGQWAAEELSADNHRQLWIPAGFAHGFVVRTDHADVSYKVTGYYDPASERTIAWDDPDLAIEWGLDGRAPVLSAKDAAGARLGDAELFD